MPKTALAGSATVSVTTRLAPTVAVRQRRLLLLLLPLLALAVFLVYRPVLNVQTLSSDDYQYLTENYPVQHPGWASARRFLTEVLHPSTVTGYYQPLTMISLMLDWACGGRPEDLRVFHRTSLSLHIANTLLIAVVLYLLFGRAEIATAVALLFGLHPLTVEPVAWIADRKTLLATFFALTSVALYLLYVRKRDATGRHNAPGGTRGAWLFLAGSLLAFVAALMSKPTSVPLPLAMLALDFWPLRRLCWRTLLEKAPFAAIALVMAFITYESQVRSASVVTPGQRPPFEIPMVIAHNIVFYLGKIVWPAQLSSRYPVPHPVSLAQPAILAGVIGTTVLLISIAASLRWTRSIVTGAAIFMMLLLPTMQIVAFANVIAADKYVYLPSIGVLLIIAWALNRIWPARPEPAASGNGRNLRALPIIALLVLIATAESWRTRAHLSVWSNNELYRQHMLSLAPDDPVLHFSLGAHYYAQKQTQRAIAELELARQIRPDPDTLVLLAVAYTQENKLELARSYLEQARGVAPHDYIILYNLGNIARLQGNTAAAIAWMQQSLAANPMSARVHRELAAVLSRFGRAAEALAHLDKAIAIEPEVAEARCARADTLADLGRGREAIDEYKLALQSRPDYAEAQTNLSAELLRQGRFEDAVASAHQAVKLQPDHAKPHYNLGVALAQLSRVSEGMAELTRAVELNPGMAEAHNNLGVLYLSNGDLAAARRELQQAVRLRPDYLDARLNLAILLDQAGESAAALAQYREVLRLDPASASARQRLATAPAN